MLLKQYWGALFATLILLPLVASALFTLWIRRRPDLSVENATKCWDVFLKFISAMTAICAGAFVFAKYVDQRVIADRDARVVQEREYLKEQLDHELERQKLRQRYFGEAKQVAAELARADDVSAATADRDRFDELYSASLIGVERKGGSVEAAMVAFRSALEDPDRKGERFALSIRLSQACEEELKEGEAAIESARQEIRRLAPRD